MSEILLKDLNEMAKGNPTEMIRRAEESYHSKIGEIAARVVNSEDIRIVLLAGPSGSGKTTSANMLADAIRDRGEEVLVISLDDFYRNTDDPNYPRLASGEQDFETVEALDIPTLNETLADIAEENRNARVCIYGTRLRYNRGASRAESGGVLTPSEGKGA